MGIQVIRRRVLRLAGLAAAAASLALTAVWLRDPWHAEQVRYVFLGDPDVVDAPGDDAGTGAPHRFDRLEIPSYLVEIPQLQFDPHRHTATRDEALEIARLIEALTNIEPLDPVEAKSRKAGVLALMPATRGISRDLLFVDQGLETSDQMRRLVELGPRALPALLAALDDESPTRFVVRHGGELGLMRHGREVVINPANPGEQAACAEHGRVLGTHGELLGRERPSRAEPMDWYHVTRGDIAFLVLGQIVGRDYSAVAYQATANYVVNSPAHDSRIAAAVRAVWGSGDPARTLFQSLVADFSTRGGAAGYQLDAVPRLGLYFPNEARELLIQRIDGLDVERGWIDPDVEPERWENWMRTNGDIEPTALLGAFASNRDPAITDAVVRVVQRTVDPWILQHCLTDGVVAAIPDLAFVRVSTALQEALRTEDAMDSIGAGLLLVSAERFGERARPHFERFLEHESSEARRAVIAVLRTRGAGLSWSFDLLAPLLDDRSLADGTLPNGSPMRVCYLAAQAIADVVPGATYPMQGGVQDLDRRLVDLRSWILAQRADK